MRQTTFTRQKIMNSELNQTAQHPFLRSLSPEHLPIVLHNAKELNFCAQEVIVRQGEPANLLFLIESGRVAIETGTLEGKSVQTLGAGEVLGWSWMFPPFNWHFTARALEPTRCTVLDGGHLLVIAEENPEFGYDLMRRISQVLVNRLQATGKRLAEVSAINSLNQDLQRRNYESAH